MFFVRKGVVCFRIDIVGGKICFIICFFLFDI